MAGFIRGALPPQTSIETSLGRDGGYSATHKYAVVLLQLKVKVGFASLKK